MGEEDTESMLMMEVVEEPEPVPGPQGQDTGAPTAPPKKAPPNFNHGLKKKKRHSNKNPLSDKPQDLQVCFCDYTTTKMAWQIVIRRLIVVSYWSVQNGLPNYIYLY